MRLCETEARLALTSVTVNATAFTCKYDRRLMAAVGDTWFFFCVFFSSMMKALVLPDQGSMMVLQFIF